MHFYALSHICSTSCSPGLMAVKPTANEKKVYAKYLASKLVEGNWKITEDDSDTQEEWAVHSFAFFAYFYALVRNQGALPSGVM